MAVQWNLLGSPPDIAGSVSQGFATGMKLNALMRDQRDQRRIRHARSAFATNPDDPEARRVLTALDPAFLTSAEDAAYKRDERKRAGDFRSAFSDYVVAGEGGATAPPQVPSVTSTDHVAFNPPNALLMPGNSPPQSSAFSASGPSGPVPERVPQLTAAELMAREDELTPPIGQPISRGPPSAFSPAPPGAGVSFGGTEPNALLPPDAVSSLTAPTVPTSRAPSLPLTERTGAWRRMVAADPTSALTAKANLLKMGKEELALADAVTERNLELLDMARDQPSYEAAVAQARADYQRHGMDPSILDAVLPPEYNPDTIHQLRMHAMDTKELLTAVRLDRREEWNREDDRLDNARADREAGSRDTYRREQIRTRGSRGRGGTARAPTKATVIGRLLDKQARGEPLTPAETKVLGDHGGAREIYQDGTIIQMPDGSQRERKGGRWVKVDG